MTVFAHAIRLAGRAQQQKHPAIQQAAVTGDMQAARGSQAQLAECRIDCGRLSDLARPPQASLDLL
jgi:hypothetical protein